VLVFLIKNKNIKKKSYTYFCVLLFLLNNVSWQSLSDKGYNAGAVHQPVIWMFQSQVILRDTVFLTFASVCVFVYL
jgi:hypothetical protein